MKASPMSPTSPAPRGQMRHIRRPSAEAGGAAPQGSVQAGSHRRQNASGRKHAGVPGRPGMLLGDLGTPAAPARAEGLKHAEVQEH